MPSRSNTLLPGLSVMDWRTSDAIVVDPPLMSKTDDLREEQGYAEKPHSSPSDPLALANPVDLTSARNSARGTASDVLAVFNPRYRSRRAVVGVSGKYSRKTMLVSVIAVASDGACTKRADQLTVAEHPLNEVSVWRANEPVKESTIDRAPPFPEHKHDVKFVSATVSVDLSLSSARIAPPSPTDDMVSNKQRTPLLHFLFA
ncbi:hypothetical protein BLNAU_431 [Blattamonas nauphoetae]|uniref:Uncharacterized protein n=1 Tax=Blattamonas nauphoetae TaxID=2049346 RepID=A0ABQ9YL83_9EUKA|nr:hypothetical protein BLNAU_431 [Blattamonas nauphoetae]